MRPGGGGGVLGLAVRLGFGSSANEDGVTASGWAPVANAALRLGPLSVQGWQRQSIHWGIHTTDIIQRRT